MAYAGDDGQIILPFNRSKQILDRLKKLCISNRLPDAESSSRFDKTTKDGKDMSGPRELLSKSISSIVGKKEERAIASLFNSGGTYAKKGEFQGINDFEVVAYLVILDSKSGDL